MTAIFSMLAILAIAVWFYQSAQRLNVPAVAWMVGGVIVYYGGFLGWMHGVLRPLMAGNFQTHGFWTGIGMDLSSILAGVLVAALFRSKVLLKQRTEA